MSYRRLAPARSGSKDVASSKGDVYRLEPFQYLHVLDQNTNVTRIEVGPQTFICQDHERVVLGPEKMIVVLPRNYVQVRNPVKRDDDTQQPLKDKYGQVMLSYGEEEIRLHREPFPLYPGEELSVSMQSLKLIPRDECLRLRALQNFVDTDDEKRIAGDEWLFEGPKLYVPNPNVSQIGQYAATIVKKNQALRLTATQDTIDRDENHRVAGEEWMVKTIGSYLPGVFEKIVSVVNAHILTETRAIWVRATKSFTDEFGEKRKNGEEWLVTYRQTNHYIPSVNEEIFKNIEITTLSSRQYCVIMDPYDADTRQNQLGGKRLVRGERSFFLKPGERLERGVQDVHVLGLDEGLILSADEQFVDSLDGLEILRKPGDRWMIRGPMEYVPPVQARVLRKNRAIPLSKNEGVYIRNIKSGRVEAKTGETYMLNENEELWDKQLPEYMERLLTAPTEFGRVPEEEMAALMKVKRDNTRVVSYRVPHNCCVQIYDYRDKSARCVFGPSLVMLGPDEIFTSLSLSGGCPKKPNVIKTIHLMLGPDFCTDIVAVETSDHARLKLELSYNWKFCIPPEYMQTPKLATKLFNVGDFIGDLCSKVAAHIRGAVAAVPFDDFHKNSARLIRAAVFGLDERGKVRDEFLITANDLSVTGIDIKSIEPEDRKTRESLQKSVQLAIEITTQSQQALAQQEADRIDQQAQGKLQRLKINDQAEAEKARKSLSEMEAQCRAVETTGQARAEAKGLAEAAKIKGETAVEHAKLKAESKKIQTDSQMKLLDEKRKSELEYLKEKQKLEAEHAKKMAEIQASKFQDMIKAIGKDTITGIAKEGPALQRAMLSSLGINAALITDGKQPINLFQNAANVQNALPEQAMAAAVYKE